jgi:hypothetical protein
MTKMKTIIPRPSPMKYLGVAIKSGEMESTDKDSYIMQFHYRALA